MHQVLQVLVELPWTHIQLIWEGGQGRRVNAVKN